MVRLGKARTFRVELSSDAVLERLRGAPPRQSGPAKNLFALARPPSPDALELHQEDDAVWVAWVDAAKPGLAQVRVREIDEDTTELEIRAARAPAAPWKSRISDGAAWCALVSLCLSFFIPIVGLVFLASLLVMGVSDDGRSQRRRYAKQCNAIAAEVRARIQPFALPEGPLAPYRGVS